MSRFSQFSDEEIYILKRQAMESSGEIVCGSKYNKQSIDVHIKLLNEITEEDTARLYSRAGDPSE